MSIQKFFAIFIALAVLFAPALTSAGEAFAAVPDHHSQVMKGGHCEQAPAGPAHSDEAAEDKCCVSMCMAVAVSPAPPVAEKMVRSAAPLNYVRDGHAGVTREIATPPPRSA